MIITEELLLACASADVTPQKSVEMIGFGRQDEMSRGVMAPLIAASAVFSKGAEIACLIAIDHIGFSTEHSSRLRCAVAKRLGTKKECVMLCFSHTHSAPNDCSNAGYYEMAEERILASLSDIEDSLKPVKIGWANAYADIGVNRRGGDGALDRRVGVCAAFDEGGKPAMLLLRLTAHGNVLKGDNYLISPDYFGAARRALAERFGCPVLLTQGASGNVAPKYFTGVLNPPDTNELTVRSDSGMDEMAKLVLSAVESVIGSIKPESGAELKAKSVNVTFYADVPDDAAAERVAGDAMKYCGIDGAAWLSEVKRLHEAGITEQTENAELQYLRIGRGCLCGVPNELMTELAIDAERLSGDEFFYLGGYTNGCTGYLPTAEEFDKGGYEVYWSMLGFFMYFARVYPLRRESAEELVSAAVKNING